MCGTLKLNIPAQTWDEAVHYISENFVGFNIKNLVFLGSSKNFNEYKSFKELQSLESKEEFDDDN